MRPSSGNGRNSAERAPTTTRASPVGDGAPGARAARVARDRNAIRPARAPKRSAKRSSHCAVSAISGSSTSDLLALAQRGGDRLEIDLGLAGAGDAVEQRDARSRRPRPVRHSASAAARCAALERRPCAIGVRPLERAAAAADSTVSISPASTRPCTTPVATPASRASSPRSCAAVRRASTSSTRRAPASGARPLAPRRRRATRARPDCGFGGSSAARTLMRHAQHGARRRQRVVRHPVDEVPHDLGQRRRRRAFRRSSFSFALRDIAGRLAPDHADQPRGCPSGTTTKSPRRNAERRRHAIVVGAGQRQRQQDAERAGGVRARTGRAILASGTLWRPSKATLRPLIETRGQAGSTHEVLHRHRRHQRDPRSRRRPDWSTASPPTRRWSPRPAGRSSRW